MLAVGLRKAHRALDEAAIASVITRAFGAGWQEQQHKVVLPMGAIMRAIRCGGGASGAQAAPAMLQLRPGTATNTVVGAVQQIVPVGKFKHKLASALKVGMSKQPVAEAAAPRAAAAAASPDAAPGASGLRQRRATQEAVNAAVAAVLTNDVAVAAARKTGKPAAVVSAAEGVVAAAPRHGAANVPASSAAGDSVVLQQQQQQQGGSDVHASALADDPAAPQHELEPAANAARTASRDSALAQARADFKVDVLSAMECVRQSWLKEEGDRFTSSSGVTYAGAAAAAPGSSSSGAAGVGPDAAASTDSRDGARSSSASGAGYTMPLTPALRLSEVRQALHFHAAVTVAGGADGAVSGSGRSNRSSSSFRNVSAAGTSSCRSQEGSTGGGSSTCGSEATTARLESFRSLAGQHSLKPILLQGHGEAAASSRAPKHVQISTADTVLTFDASTAVSSEALAAASGGQHQEQQQGLVSPAAGLSTGSHRLPPPWADDGAPSPSHQQLELSFKRETPAADSAASADTAAEDAAADSTTASVPSRGWARHAAAAVTAGA
jgi:hypothetical protein